MQVHGQTVSNRYAVVNCGGIYQSVTSPVSARYHSTMTIRDIHIQNLTALIRQYKTLDGLLDVVAESGETPISKKYLQNILNGVQSKGYNRQRDLGPAVCRRIERAIGEAEGWMDVSHASNDQVTDRIDAGIQGKAVSEPDGMPLSVDADLTPRERALLGNFRRMASHQQDELIRESEEIKQANERIIKELSRNKTANGNGS